MNTLQLAQLFWSQVVSPGDNLIDATLGNGHDTCFLAKMLKGKGKIISYDIQQQAHDRATLLFDKSLTEEEKVCITLKKQSHEHFGSIAPKLIVYNLGYLPGGDKTLTTKRETTLLSLENATKCLLPGGLISVTCYPGHAEGAREQEALISWTKTLSPRLWSVFFYSCMNRTLAPNLISIWRQREIIT